MNSIPYSLTSDEDTDPRVHTQEAGESLDSPLEGIPSLAGIARKSEDRALLISAASRIAGTLIQGQGPRDVDGIVKRSLAIARGIIAAVDAKLD